MTAADKCVKNMKGTCHYGERYNFSNKSRPHAALRVVRTANARSQMIKCIH
jgi:hypothetical protein